MQWLSTAELKPYTPHGNANNPDTLEKASVKNADAIIIAYEQDADNIITLLSINEFLQNSHSNIKITIRINQENSLQKAKMLGATKVISPLVMAAQAMLNLA